jgi:hypothetical protein
MRGVDGYFGSSWPNNSSIALMANYGGVFDFPDYGLSDNDSELLDPLDSAASEASENEEDAWYNMPSGSDDDDDEDTAQPVLTLLLRLADPATLTN